MPNDRELPSILGFRIEPWVNLLHAIGLPWTIIGISVWYGVPWARSMSDNIKDMKEEAIKTNKRLDDVYNGVHALEIHADRVNSGVIETSKQLSTNTLILKSLQNTVQNQRAVEK